MRREERKAHDIRKCWDASQFLTELGGGVFKTIMRDGLESAWEKKFDKTRSRKAPRPAGNVSSREGRES